MLRFKTVDKSGKPYTVKIPETGDVFVWSVRPETAAIPEGSFSAHTWMIVEVVFSVKGEVLVSPCEIPETILSSPLALVGYGCRLIDNSGKIIPWGTSADVFSRECHLIVDTHGNTEKDEPLVVERPISIYTDTR